VEKYWKGKRNRCLELLNNRLVVIGNQRLYTYRQCQRRGIEIADNESTFL
jgi:hypothetical protein